MQKSAKDVVLDWLKAAGMSMDDLRRALAEHAETEISLKNLRKKIYRGGFSADFLIACNQAVAFQTNKSRMFGLVYLSLPAVAFPPGPHRQSA